MVRLLGIDLPKNKRIEYALTYIHGIGLTSAKKIVNFVLISNSPFLFGISVPKFLSEFFSTSIDPK